VPPTCSGSHSKPPHAGTPEVSFEKLDLRDVFSPSQSVRSSTRADQIFSDIPQSPIVSAPFGLKGFKYWFLPLIQPSPFLRNSEDRLRHFPPRATGAEVVIHRLNYPTFAVPFAARPFFLLVQNVEQLLPLVSTTFVSPNSLYTANLRVKATTGP